MRPQRSTSGIFISGKGELEGILIRDWIKLEKDKTILIKTRSTGLIEEREKRCTKAKNVGSL